MPVSLTRQIGAIESLIAIQSGRPKPTASQMEMLIADAREGVATLRQLKERPLVAGLLELGGR